MCFVSPQVKLLDEHFKLRYEDIVTSSRLIYGDFLVPGESLSLVDMHPKVFQKMGFEDTSSHLIYGDFLVQSELLY